LKNYLDNGGSLYLEGGDLGYWHAPGGSGYNFGLWSYLKTQWVNDGNSTNNVSSVVGENIWPAADMKFGYPYGTGPDAYVDVYAPLTGAELQFKDQLNRGRVISYTEVSRGYTTYTSAIIFGAFIDDPPMSTQDRLMARIVAELLGTDTVPPAVVTDISLDIDDETITLTWDHVSDDIGGGREFVDSYVIYRATDPDGPWTSLGYAIDPLFEDQPGTLNDPSVDTTYRIRCVDTAGNTGDAGGAGEFEFDISIP